MVTTKRSDPRLHDRVLDVDRAVPAAPPEATPFGELLHEAARATKDHVVERVRGLGERAVMGGALGLLGAAVLVVAAFLLLTGLTGLLALAVPDWAARLIVGGVIVLGFVVALLVVRGASRKKRLQALVARYQPVADRSDADGDPAHYASLVERRLRSRVRHRTANSVERFASLKNLALVAAGTFAFGRLVRRKPALLGALGLTAMRAAAPPAFKSWFSRKSPLWAEDVRNGRRRDAC